MRCLFTEPERDEKLRSALQGLEALSTPTEAEPLRRRIMAAAGPVLAELRSPAPRWWDWISDRMRVLVPIGVAAAVAAGILVGTSRDATTQAGYSVVTSADSALALAAYSDPSSGSQLVAGLIAPESGDWLLEQAVTQ